MVEGLLAECRRLESRLATLREAIDVLRGSGEGTSEPAAKPASGRTRSTGPKRSTASSGRLTIGKAALQILERADRPMNTVEVADAINAEGLMTVNANSVSVAFLRLREGGRVREVPESRPFRWVLAEEP